MRVTTDLWVSALIRRVFAAGGFAAIARRGATEAGAVFVIVRDRFGQSVLYGPAPQTSYHSARPDDRMFVNLNIGVDQDEVESRLQKEGRFDPDIWVIEIEPGAVAVDELIAMSPA